MAQSSYLLKGNGSNSPKTCEYLKSRGTNIIHKLLAMARCSVHSRRLVTALREELTKVLPPRIENERKEFLTCSTCEGYMTRPVQLPCGHSHCQLCIDKSSEKDKEVIVCSKCQETHVKVPAGFTTPRRPTLMLVSVCAKYYPQQMITCCQERERGNEFAQKENYQMAIEYYNKALSTGCSDHRVYGNRSLAYLAIGCPNESLEDAEQCCKLRPNWPKGHYRRGRALAALGEYHQSTAAYLLSLHLGGGELQCLCQALDNLVASQAYSSLDTQQLMVSIVTIAVETMSKYQETPLSKSSSLLPFDPSIVEQIDFECVLCTCLIFNPVTVPCGHTFCCECLARLFDHSPFCPVCRSSLGETFTQHTQSAGQMCIDKTMEQLIQHIFPLQYEEKRLLCQSEKLRLSRVGTSETEELPIFICTMGFPGMPCPLHIFEPRYRLMMRRCIDNNSRRFGICAPTDNTGSFADYGTVLFISSLEYTPDGRSLVTTVGERRFQVLERNTKDGYAVAKIKFISDEPTTEDLGPLESHVYGHCMKWLYSLPFFTRLTVIQSVSSPPPELNTSTSTSHDGPSWVWWFINAIPSSHHNKLQFLSSISLKQRLLLLQETLPLPT